MAPVGGILTLWSVGLGVMTPLPQSGNRSSNLLRSTLPWSSGDDATLSKLRGEFNSRREYQVGDKVVITIVAILIVVAIINLSLNVAHVAQVCGLLP